MSTGKLTTDKSTKNYMQHTVGQLSAVTGYMQAYYLDVLAQND